MDMLKMSDIEILQGLKEKAGNRELGINSINYYYALKHLLDSKMPNKVYEVENDFTGLPVTHCPKCNIALPMYLYGREYDGELQFCPYCGQALTW